MPKKTRRKPPNARDLPWDKVGLGTRYDTDIAAELECSLASVVAARNARGIPPYVPQGHRRTVDDPTVSRGVRLPESQWGGLDEAAAERETTTPKLLRVIVAEWLERHLGRSKQ